MNHANIVSPEEMEESRWFLGAMVEALTVRAYVRAEVTCVTQGWGTLREGCSCDGEPLVLGGAALQQQGFCFALPKRAGAIWLYQRVVG